MNGTSGLKWILASLFVAGSGAAPAHEHDPGTRIVIVKERDVGDGHAKGESRHPAAALADCSGGDTLFANSGEDKAAEGKERKTRILICGRGEANAAARAKALEHALARIDSDDRLSAATRTRITTALREAITRLNDAR